jgi:hypothetical protein
VKDNVTPGTRGAINELRICGDLMNRGYTVYRALGPHAACDLIVVKAGTLLRLEVKTGQYRVTGTPTAPFRVGQRASCDVVAYVMADDTILYEPDLP